MWKLESLSESSVLLDQEKYIIINRGCTIITVKGDIYIREQNITKLSEKEMTDIRLKKSASFSSSQILFHI